jgi:FtsP/CotA-like multicopper oxidase with cupredoxin domain
MNRRNFLRTAAIAGTASLLPLYLSRPAIAGYSYSANDFRSPLAIPPEYHGYVKNGKRVFDLLLQHGITEFFSGYNTPTLGINGSYLGPVLRLKRGDEAVFNVGNGLIAPSTIHWHGMHLPGRMDGGPHQAIGPGEIWRPEFVIRQPASTLWYHSHLHQLTGAQVYQGLAGLLYIDDENSLEMEIPNTYGVDDIPLVIQDRNFNRDGSFRYISNMRDRMAGIQGGQILVNGVVRPQHHVARKQMRFRVLNGSNARIYNLKFSDNRAFVQIASDGGFLPRPIRLNRLRLAPGERAEIIVEFSHNEELMLQHEPLPAGNRGMGMMAMMMSGNDQPFNIMRLLSNTPGGEMARLPDQLATMPDWSEQQAVKTRRFQLDMTMGMGMMSGGGSGFTINNRPFDMGRIDEVVRLNDIEIWEFTNKSPMPHPVHIHDIQFRILSRNNGQPGVNEHGLKDTVLVNPNETVRVMTRFENYADEASPYMYHCHILEHEDQGMMAQFVVVS